MIVIFDKSFSKSLDKINDPSILKRIESVILKLEEAESIERMPNTKKLTGYISYYRVKTGDYRIGFELVVPGKVRIITVLHRKDIYKKFP
jgi:mRNA interferase RelE/StbE